VDVRLPVAGAVLRGFGPAGEEPRVGEAAGAPDPNVAAGDRPRVALQRPDQRAVPVGDERQRPEGDRHVGARTRR